MFKIGQEIVCVDDSCQRNDTMIKVINKVKKNKTYSFRGLSLYGGVLLNEFVHGFHLNGQETGFKPSRFRPLSDVLAEISLTELMEEPVEC